MHITEWSTVRESMLGRCATRQGAANSPMKRNKYLVLVASASPAPGQCQQQKGAGSSCKSVRSDSHLKCSPADVTGLSRQQTCALGQNCSDPRRRCSAARPSAGTRLQMLQQPWCGVRKVQACRGDGGLMALQTQNMADGPPCEFFRPCLGFVADKLH